MMSRARAIFCLTCLIVLAPLAAPAAADDQGGFKFNLPAAVVAEAVAPSGAPITYAASATFDGRPARLVCAPPSGAVFPLGATAVSCVASYRDRSEHTNTATAMFPTFVHDTTPPALSVPAPVVVHTNLLAGVPSTTPAIAQFLSRATATDLVDGSDAVTSDAPPTFGFGVRTITFTAVDRAGNRSVATASIQVVLDSARMLYAPQPGVMISASPTLVWAPVAKAAFYNVQLYRGSSKILSAWPSSAKLRVRPHWTYGGKKRLLRPGRYTWYVWPAFGGKLHGHYGKLLGVSTFTVG